MGTRRYTLRKRAEAQEDTRARIVDAMIEVHRDLGPRNATVSAIAQKAGVQRLTVYRHFPDDESLFEACTSTWLQRNPPPDPAAFQGVSDPVSRTRRGLESLYAYFGSTHRMWAVSYRDVEEVPALQGPMAGFEAWLDDFHQALLGGWRLRGARRERLADTLALALRFHTWQTLDTRGLDDTAKAGLVMEWLMGIAGGRRAR
ncbi:TetR/AcrR family transcriptional regulator [Thioalkalivibrio denitrificans]|nr:TetR/AcrR family transcriptional regulator [Thioalkalivibrio denitrificans]